MTLDEEVTKFHKKKKKKKTRILENKKTKTVQIDP
mgnify:CR=1 FL=1